MADEWQPIKTAPKDGTSILVICYSKHSTWYDVAYWDANQPEPFNWMTSAKEGNHRDMYTHWQPLFPPSD